MTTEQTIRAAIDAWVAGDLEAAMGHCSDDATYRVMARPGLGAFEADCRGRDAFRETLLGLLSEFDMLHYELLEVIASGERAATRQKLRMRHKASGRDVETEIAGFWTVRDGRISALDEWHDTAQIAAARGRTAPIPAA